VISSLAQREGGENMDKGNLFGIEIRILNNGYLIHVSKSEPEENWIADTTQKVASIIKEKLDEYHEK